MKKFSAGIIIFIFAAVLLNGNVKAQGKASIVGIWQTVADEGEDKGKAASHVEIFEKDGTYFGKVIKLLLKPQDTLCDKCVGDLKNKPVVGMIFLKDMKKTGKVDEDFGEEYAGGTIMDPDNGKTYRCKMWVKGDTLTSRGYLAFFFRTQTWSRIK